MAHVSVKAPAIIPKGLAKDDDLVVIPRKEYEQLRANKLVFGKDIVILEEIPFSNLTKEQRAAYRKARRTPLSKMLNM